MKEDIYELLNNGDFGADEYKKSGMEGFDDLKVQNIKKYVKENSKVKVRSKRFKAAVAVAVSMVMLGASNSAIRAEVESGVTNIINKIDPKKNYESDYVVNLNDSFKKDGVEIRLDRCNRYRNMMSLVYTMNFDDGVPESIKGKKYIKKGTAYNGEEIEETCYENDGLEGVKIKINDFDNMKESGIKYCQSEDVEVGEKSITKRVIFNLGDLLDESRLKEDLNVKIEYENIISNSGKEIKGPWVIEYKLEAESESPKIEEIKLDKDYGYTMPDGKVVTIDSYVITNTDVLIHGTEHNCKYDIPIICLSGGDNLGNRVIMTPFTIEDDKEGNRKIEFRLSRNQAQSDSGSYLENNIKSIKVSLHAVGEGLHEPLPGETFTKVADEFTINMQEN